MCVGVDWTYLAQDRLKNEAVVIYFKALFNNSFGETEKNTRNFSQDGHSGLYHKCSHN